MKKVIVLGFSLLVLTACQVVPNENYSAQQNNNAPSDESFFTVAQPVQVESSQVTDEPQVQLASSPADNAPVFVTRNSSNPESDILGADFNVCQHQLSALQLYNKKAFSANKRRLDQHVVSINRYLSIRASLSEHAANYFDGKYKGVVNDTCLKIKRDIEKAITANLSNI